METPRPPVFLIGGGWNQSANENTYGHFVNRATREGFRKIAVVLISENPDDKLQTELKYKQVLKACGVQETEMQFFWGTPEAPVRLDLLVEGKPSGVFVGGGTTPLYHQMLCKDLTWLEYIKENHIPYAGFSAGAAIAAEQAVLGGWKTFRDGHELEILDEELSEGLDVLSVKPGLGLVPFSVDVHASQWGTVTRLMQVIEQEISPEGWAVDENTMMVVEHGQVQIFGRGQAYHLQRQTENSVMVKMHRAEN